jgi:cell division protein FtsB
MSTTKRILNSLERERELVIEFRSISEEQLRLLDDENIDGVESLLARRADLMIELQAIESTLATWISQIKDDPTVSPEMMRELKSVNDEIVEMAREVVAIDSETHWRLDLIRESARKELNSVNTGLAMMRDYGSGMGDQERPRLDLAG